jgi:flagellar P-ring protein precursor FlgI
MTRMPRLALALGAWILLGSLAEAQTSSTTRLKDVTRLQGIASTPAIGYGLVVGLNKTGDRRQTIFSAQTLANMLEQFGIDVPAGQIKVENVAAVLVTIEVPPFARAGTRLDVTVASVGDARSLQGGILLPTPLRGPDGQIRATAQGPLSLGGFGGGSGGNNVQVNHLTAGRVPAGALVHVEMATSLPPAETIQLSLNDPDFSSAERVAESVNRELGDGSAVAADAATVTVRVPQQYRGAIAPLVARLEPLPVEIDAIARVVINERTGTVVVGGAVRLGPAAVAHGNLSVRIATRLTVSQPAPFSSGDTKVVPQQDVEVDEGRNQLMVLEQGTTLEAVVQGLNALGASPRDIIAIMQALKAAGALRAELVIL